MGDTGERKGSGLKRGHLTRESILREALTLVDEKGFDALSLRTLGKRLGVSQAAFYRHIPDKAALLDGVAEIIWQEVFDRCTSALSEESFTAVSTDWKMVFILYAHCLMDILHSHPNAVILVLTHPMSTANEFASAARLLVQIADLGVPLPGNALGMINMVTMYVGGVAAAEVAPPAGGAAKDIDEGLAGMLAAAGPREKETLTDLLKPMDTAGWSFSHLFETGLNALLHGWDAV